MLYNIYILHLKNGQCAATYKGKDEELSNQALVTECLKDHLIIQPEDVTQVEKIDRDLTWEQLNTALDHAAIEN